MWSLGCTLFELLTGEELFDPRAVCESKYEEFGAGEDDEDENEEEGDEEELSLDEKDEEAEQLAMGTVIRGKYQLLRTLAGANLGRCGKRGYCMMSRWKRRCRQRMKRVRWRRW